MADEIPAGDAHFRVRPGTRRDRRVGSVIAVLFLLSTITLSWWNWPSTPKSGLEAARRLAGNPEQALQRVRSCIQAAHEDNPQARLFECQMLLELNRGNEAEESFNQIHHPETCDPDSLYEVAVRATTANRLLLAKQALAATGDFVHRDARRIKLLTYVLYSLRDRPSEKQVLELCQQYASLVPDDPFPWLISSSLYRELNNSQLAFESYREALKRSLPPEEAERVRMELVEVTLLLGDLTTARETYDALVQMSRTPALSGQLMDLQTQLLYREGKLVELVNLLDEILKKQPKLTDARALRGKCRVELGDDAGAIADLQAVVQENDFDQKSQYLLGQACLRQKEVDRGQFHLNRSRELIEIGAQIMTVENQLRNDPQSRELKLQLVELNEKRGDHEKAAAWRREAEVVARPPR